MRDALPNASFIGVSGTTDKNGDKNTAVIFDSAVEILGDEILKTMARELVESVKNSVTIDWTIKESVQAKMRVMIKRILKKYNYPPDKQEQAVKTILKQAKMMADDLSG